MMLAALVLSVTILLGPPEPDLVLVKTAGVTADAPRIAREVACERVHGEASVYLLVDRTEPGEGETAPAAYYHEVVECR